MTLKNLIAAITLGGALTAAAANPILPDPAVKIGKLDNGLTYYIQRNATPAGQADFFIAQRVGSINEQDDQQGLAHFLEHMCFNGTEHFPGNSLISYLETLGVKFGKNLNAYTSTDETVYNICAVPTTRQSALDSCVMILSDWSGRLLLNDDDIDSERGVIQGEMRQRSSAASRLLTALAPEIYQGNIYGRRMPIGTAEVVDNFDHNTLREYYHKWYHPANQAVIIVGDIDPEVMEAAIHRHFDDIKAGPEAVTATHVAVEDNAQPIYAVGSDPEMAQYSVAMYFKNPELPAADRGTIAEVRQDYMRRLISNMLVERFDDIENRPGCPWSNLGIGDQKFLLSGTRDALMMRGTAADAESAERAIATLWTEMQRAAMHGFTATELQRAKVTDRAARNADLAKAPNETNTQLARKYVKHFTRGGIIPSTEQLYKMMNGVERTTTLDQVNDYLASVVKPDGYNNIIMVYTPAGSTLDREAVAKSVASVDLASIEPFVDTFAGRKLMEMLPTPGKIVADEPAGFGSRRLTLSNGIKVYLRPDTTNADQILIRGVSPGGFAMNYDPKDKTLYQMANDVLSISGFGGHSSVDLRKLLAGHNVKSIVKIGNTTEELAASTNRADLETALQLLFLKATSANRDDNAYGALMTATRSRLENPNRSATYAMGDSIHAIVYRRHPFGAKLGASDLDNITYDQVLNLHRNRFSNMGDFTFIITGDFDNDSIAGLIEQYVASLPGDASYADKVPDTGYGFFSGKDKKQFTHAMEQTPQSIAYSFFDGECPYDLEHVLTAQTFGQILRTRLMNELREKRGLTYTINSHCSVTTGFNGPATPSRFILPVYVKVAPGHEEEVFDVVRSTIADLSTNGPTAGELAKIKSFLLKEIGENRTDNAYWETVIKVAGLYGPDMDSDYERIVEAMTPAGVAAFGARYITGADHVELSMIPE